MVKTCKTCKYEGDKHICSICQVYDKGYSLKWQPKEAEKVEDKAYTTGQMIDMLLENKMRKATTDGAIGLYIGYIDSRLCWINEMSNQYHADYLIFFGDDGTKWRIIEPKPKRTYKDVLLERFPKISLTHMLEYFRPQHIFGCHEDVEWYDEYKEEEGE